MAARKLKVSFKSIENIKRNVYLKSESVPGPCRIVGIFSSTQRLRPIVFKFGVRSHRPEANLPLQNFKLRYSQLNNSTTNIDNNLKLT